MIPIHSHEGLATRLKPIPFCTALKIPYSFAPALSDCDLAYQERRFGNCSVVLLQVKSLETEPLLQLKAFLARHAESPILFEVQLASYEPRRDTARAWRCCVSPSPSQPSLSRHPANLAQPTQPAALLPAAHPPGKDFSRVPRAPRAPKQWFSIGFNSFC